jgi:hypothetical protein
MGLHTDPQRAATQLLSYARAVELAERPKVRKQAIRSLHAYLRELVADGWATSPWDIKLMLTDYMGEADAIPQLTDLERTSLIAQQVGGVLEKWAATGRSHWVTRSDRP